jgi:5-methylcytosine-specific restriction enzyme A
MPYSPRGVCLQDGCPVLVRRPANRCPAHQRKIERPSRQQRGYGAEWQQVRVRVLERDLYLCHYCGRPANTVDHQVPKARGGGDEESNLVAACLSCNSRKQDR